MIRTRIMIYWFSREWREPFLMKMDYLDLFLLNLSIFD